MALIRCSECGKQISSLAAACPSCGAPNPAGAPAAPDQTHAGTRNRASTHRWRGKLLVAAAIFLAIIFGVVAREREEKAQAEQAAQKSAEAAAARTAEYNRRRAGLFSDATRLMLANKAEDVVALLEPWQGEMDAALQQRFDWAMDATAESRAENKRTERAVEEAKLNAELSLVAKLGKRPVQSAWDGSYYEVERYLKRTANDPDSIDIEGCTTVVAGTDGWNVRCRFRGTNAFGAKILLSQVFVIKNGQVVRTVD